MGDMTLSEIRTEVHAALSNRSDLSNARIDSIINLSQRRIARRYRFEELTETNEIDVGASSITLPADVHKLYHISIRDKADTSGYTSPLRWVPKKRILQLEQLKSSPNTRRPHLYARWGRTLRVYAPPDKTYLAKYTYSKYPTKLADDADASDFEMLDDAIIALSVSWFFASFGNTDEANRWFRIFNNSMGDAQLEDTDRPDGEISPSTAPSADSPTPRYYEDPFVMRNPSVG